MLILGVALLFGLFTFDLPVVQPQIGGSDPTKVLKLVHTLFRHGNRTPSKLYPNDPYINEKFYPYGLSQLTNAGKLLLFENGEWLKQQYGNYLGSYYDPDELWAQAADYPRTIMSMGTALAGLFPPQGTPLEWNKNLDWQPIPIFAEPLNEDTLLQIPTPCPRFYDAVNEAYNPFLVENIDIISNLTALTGSNLETNYDVYTIYNTLLDEAEYGLKLPEWTNAYYPDKLKSLASISYIYNSYTDELKRIAAGPFILQMMNDWVLKINGTISPAKRKLFMYAGHGENVVDVLNALNVWTKQYPVFGIMAIFELLQDINTGVYGVKVYTKTSTEANATPLTIPGCDNFCPIENFFQLTKHVLPTNLTLECETQPLSNASSSSTSSSTLY